jgi:nucleoside-diphosphate-sugar epimerase
VKVLLTGAAGFIGGAILRHRANDGHEVVTVDALIPRAHGMDASGPSTQSADAVHRIDVRDADALLRLLDGVDVVCHQAAMVGSGVAVSDLPLYASHNDLGTAVLMAVMAERGNSRTGNDGEHCEPDHRDGGRAGPRHPPGMQRRERVDPDVPVGDAGIAMAAMARSTASARPMAAGGVTADICGCVRVLVTR